MTAIVATAIREEDFGEYEDVMILSDTESIDPVLVVGDEDEEEDDDDWKEGETRVRRQRPRVALKTPLKQKKKRERKDWCARMMRQLEILCSDSFVKPKGKTRREGHV